MKLTSLKVKVIVWFMGIMSIILLAFSMSLYYFINENLNIKIKTEMNFIAQEIYDELQKSQDMQSIVKKGDIKSFGAAIIRDQHILYKTDEFAVTDIKKYIHKHKNFFTKEIDEYFIQATYVLNFEQPFNGSIIITSPKMQNKIEEVETALLIANPILLFIMIFVGIKFVNKILNPIKSITTIAKEISIDNFQHTLIANYKEDELQELAQTFNIMIQRLKEGVERLDRFNSDVSHELRTPLTVINTQIELALKKERDYAYYQKSLSTIARESHKINRIVQDMLLLTRYSKETIAKTYILCDLNAILLNTIEKFSEFAHEKNISIEFKRFEKARYNANDALMNILFSNLIDNAIKYTPNNKSIYISIFEAKDQITFILQDEGIGISKEALKKVTDRFYRVDESRNKSIQGFGLGLSLVQNIVDLHQCKMTIESEESIGTTIFLHFL